jgi:hypothetical protein
MKLAKILNDNIMASKEGFTFGGVNSLNGKNMSNNEDTSSNPVLGKKRATKGNSKTQRIYQKVGCQAKEQVVGQVGPKVLK